MSATRLLVLGVVRAHGQAHGYQVRRELITWSADQWANIKPGSIYHALKQMAKNGMLREVGAEGSEQGPDRTVYELTEDGATEFMRLLREALTNPEAKPEMWGAGITFLTCLPRNGAIELLQYRLSNLEACRHGLRGYNAHHAPPGKPEHVWELFQWWICEYEAAIAFTQGMIERLKGGAYTMADDPGEAFAAPSRELDTPPK